MRRLPERLWRHPPRVAVYLAMTTMAFGALWRVETTAGTARDAAEDAELALDELKADRLESRRHDCRQKDEDNSTQRRISRDAPLEAIEGLIEFSAGQGDPPPADGVIEALRAIERRRLQGIVDTLPGYRWDDATEQCIEIPLDVGG